MNLIKFIADRPFLKHVGLAFLLMLILAFILLQGLKIATHHNDYIEVPDLTQKSISEVADIIADLDLRYEIIDSTKYDPKYPKFSVIAQDPEAGAKVKENRKIYVTLNPSGYRKVSVPNVIQVTRRNAEGIIKAVGLRIGKVSYINDIGKDMVLSISHKGETIYPGAMLPKTAIIDLVCGNGYAGDPLEEENTEGENNGGIQEAHGEH